MSGSAHQKKDSRFDYFSFQLICNVLIQNCDRFWPWVVMPILTRHQHNNTNSKETRTKGASPQIYKSAVQWNVIIKGLSAVRTSRNSSAFHLKHFVCLHVNYGLNIVLLAVARCQGVTCFFSGSFHHHLTLTVAFPATAFIQKTRERAVYLYTSENIPQPPQTIWATTRTTTTTLAVLATSKKGHTPVRSGPGRSTSTKKRVYGPAYFRLGPYASSPPSPPSAPLYVVKFHVSESNYDCDESWMSVTARDTASVFKLCRINCDPTSSHAFGPSTPSYVGSDKPDRKKKCTPRWNVIRSDRRETVGLGRNNDMCTNTERRRGRKNTACEKPNPLQLETNGYVTWMRICWEGGW